MIKIQDNLKIYYPLNLVPRKQQIDGFNFVKESINQANKYILLNMPTGSGKSYFTIMFINWYLNSINSKAKFDILTNSKILQNQYINDYPFIKNFKGRSNYFCDPYDTDCSKGVEICKTAGPHCKNDCPYEKAKKDWLTSDIGLTNFHLFNTLAIHVEPIFNERHSNVLIIDEAHDFESIFCDFISTSISAKSLKKYGFELVEIEHYDEKLSRMKRIYQYIGFIENQFPKDIEDKINWLNNAKENTNKKIKLEYAKYLEHCNSQITKFKYLIQEYDKKPENWILDVTKNKKDVMYSGIVLDAKPIWGNDYLKEKIFDKYDHVIFMSGSILDKKIFSFINGLDDDLSTYFETPSIFPLKNRPIYYIKLGKMTWKQKEESFKNQVIWIKKILKKYKDKKGIIHCGSYEFAIWLQEKLFDSRLIFHTPETREEALQEHIKSELPSVIVSPSMMSGIDLKDELSRFQIIMKIPFPFLGSNKIKQRQKTKKEWYNFKTVVDFIQMSGRSVRSEDDWADTFVLDGSFSDLLKYNSALIPRWFSNAIKQLKI